MTRNDREKFMANFINTNSRNCSLLNIIESLNISLGNLFNGQSNDHS